MKKIALFLCLILFLVACQKQNQATLSIEPLPEAKKDYQKRIVGQLSGEFAVGDALFIESRWSPEERVLTRQYLKAILRQLDIEPLENSYMAPNLNPAIDMILGPFKGTNIYSILPATHESEDYIVLGAHYDSGKRNAPGAIDNATGIALIYSVVKEIAKIKERKQHIVLVFFDQEEEELIGSTAFAKLMQEKGWSVTSLHCFDMVGWDEDGDRAMEMFSGSEPLRSLYKKYGERHQIPLKEIVIDPTTYNSSSTDFDVFVPLGYNAIGAGECFYHGDYSPYKDSPDDTYGTVDFDYLLSCTNLIEDIIKELVTQ